MDVLLICRDSSSSSLLTNMLLAIEGKSIKLDVGILFTGEALASFTEGVWGWPRALEGQELRLRMASNAQALDIPTKGRGEAAQIDALQLVTRAREKGVSLFAFGTWAKLLSLSGKLPEGVSELDLRAALKMVAEAKTVVGSF